MEISFLLDDTACAKLITKKTLVNNDSYVGALMQNIRKPLPSTPPPTSTSQSYRASPRKNRLPAHLSESFVIDSPKRTCRSPFRDMGRSSRQTRSTRSTNKDKSTLSQATTTEDTPLQSPKRKHQDRSIMNRSKRKRSTSYSSGTSSDPDEQDSKRQRYARRGKWLPEEEAYTITMIIAFREGLLPLESGTTLRSYVAKQLLCDPMRVTKKLSTRSCAGHPVDVKIGKSTFQPRKLEDKKKYLLQRLSIDQARFAASAGIATRPLFSTELLGQRSTDDDLESDYSLSPEIGDGDTRLQDLTHDDEDAHEIRRLNVQELQALKGLIHLFTMEENHVRDTCSSRCQLLEDKDISSQ